MDLSALVAQARGLNAHISKPEQPAIARGLDQIENDSRNLVSRLPNIQDDGRANYLLARGNIDALGLGREIAELDTAATFQPLQPLADNDVQGYLRHIHEQTLISTIEEVRKETQDEFYRVLGERVRRDWEIQKKRIFEELGGRTLAPSDTRGSLDLRRSTRGLDASQSLSHSFVPTAQMHTKMMAYDRVITEFNAARLNGSSFPIIHSLIQATDSLDNEKSPQTLQTFQILAKITGEPPVLPATAQVGSLAQSSHVLERKFARAHLGNADSREASSLRKQITRGSKEALEEQYDQIMERTIQSNPSQARLGGDPSHVNRVRSFVALRYYRSGQWENRIELIRGQPEWARLFTLVRSGHAPEALDHALSIEETLNQREPNFVTYFKAWVESGCQRIPHNYLERLQAIYNSHLLHTPTTDPFKLALFKLMGKLDPLRRNVPLVTSTTEDWMWFQLAMVDENDADGLKSLADVLLGYGERHFDGPPGQDPSRKGVWARVLLICGMFEMAVAAMYEHSELQVEAVHLAIALAYYGLLRVPSKAEASDVDIFTQSPDSKPALNLSLLISRYIRQFMRTDPKEAIQYVYSICLSEDQGAGVGRQQVEQAWDLTRRIIVAAESGGVWEELVGGFKADGTRFNGFLEHGLPLLKFKNTQDYNDHILLRAAAQSESDKRLNEAIKLYNLAGAHSTVVACLTRVLGSLISEPGGGGQEGRALERTAREVLAQYDRTNRVNGRDRDTVIRLLGIREAIDAKEGGRLEAALEAIESTDLIPLDGDAAQITTAAASLRDQDDAITQNLNTILPLTMEILTALHQKAKMSGYSDSTRQRGLDAIRKKARALMMFAGSLPYRLSPEVHSYLTRLHVGIAL
ncbi:nucleoporin-interacting protein NIC96 [Sistotremastrum niveocremeum HHB9708]|uniref:Nuclear pore protein n=1 Tax=Sistotremastrum niveocremeum HHB9708 TaxID=1314777 RepID=A0A164R9P1_9AGAM|nr:nucleoporin-interacting protein NIC96 [Sistotremastrum niveocremeum HHB9708]